MENSGLDYLLQFSKIQKNEKIGHIEAVDFETINNATQMGHLIVKCKCHKRDKEFNIPASVINWKITKYLKGALKSLDCETVSKLELE